MATALDKIPNHTAPAGVVFGLASYRGPVLLAGMVPAPTRH